MLCSLSRQFCWIFEDLVMSLVGEVWKSYQVIGIVKGAWVRTYGSPFSDSGVLGVPWHFRWYLRLTFMSKFFRIMRLVCGLAYLFQNGFWRKAHMKVLSLCWRAGNGWRRASKSGEIDSTILYLSEFNDLRYRYDYMCPQSCQISWVERKEFMGLSVSSDQGKVAAFRAVMKLDKVLWHWFKG